MRPKYIEYDRHDMCNNNFYDIIRPFYVPQHEYNSCRQCRLENDFLSSKHIDPICCQHGVVTKEGKLLPHTTITSGGIVISKQTGHICGFVTADGYVKEIYSPCTIGPTEITPRLPLPANEYCTCQQFVTYNKSKWTEKKLFDCDSCYCYKRKSPKNVEELYCKCCLPPPVESMTALENPNVPYKDVCTKKPSTCSKELIYPEKPCPSTSSCVCPPEPPTKEPSSSLPSQPTEPSLPLPPQPINPSTPPPSVEEPIQKTVKEPPSPLQKILINLPKANSENLSNSTDVGNEKENISADVQNPIVCESVVNFLRYELMGPDLFDTVTNLIDVLVKFRTGNCDDDDSENFDNQTNK